MELKEARENANMTQELVAGKLGVSRPTYRKMESNPGCVTVEDAKKLSALFGVPVSDIFFADSDS